MSNKPGYWMYSSINSVHTEYLPGNNSKPLEKVLGHCIDSRPYSK